jgi:hypothetical protein
LHFFFAAETPLEADPEPDPSPAFGHAKATEELKRRAVQAVDATIRESMARL